ncbi:MAG: DUF1735 domain-containing protein [Bacteroidota bacterium]|nr:DUF1735 domain-containing protein [Bacteroidota bacterium]
MKYKYLKSAVLFLSVGLLVFNTGCLKKKDATFVDFSGLQEFVVLSTGGYTYTTNISFARSKDTVSFTIIADLASSTNPTSPVTVTLGFDNAALAAYNAANPSQYTAVPSANYKLLSTTLTIPAGQHYAQTTLQIYTKGLSASTNYMIPVSITDASGRKLSSNMNTLYYSSIGNPLAGVYNWFGERFNEPLDTTQRVPPNYTNPRNNVSIAISPLNATSLFFPVTYLDQNGANSGTKLSFTNNAGVLSNFTASLYDAGDLGPGGASAGGFTVVTPPTLVGFKIVGTAATNYVGSVFRFYTVIQFNTSGLKRTSLDVFTKTQ